MVLVRETCEYMSTTVEGRSIWCYFGETCGYHSRIEGCVCPGEACLCQLLTDNFIASIQFCTCKSACLPKMSCLSWL